MKTYTHDEYRKAKIAHIINIKGEEQFFYKRKEISRKEANFIMNEWKNNRNLK